MRALLDKHLRVVLLPGLGVAAPTDLASNRFRTARLFTAEVDQQLKSLKNVLHSLFEM